MHLSIYLICLPNKRPWVVSSSRTVLDGYLLPGRVRRRAVPHGNYYVLLTTWLCSLANWLQGVWGGGGVVQEEPQFPTPRRPDYQTLFHLTDELTCPCPTLSTRARVRMRCG